MAIVKKSAKEGKTTAKTGKPAKAAKAAKPAKEAKAKKSLKFVETETTEPNIDDMIDATEKIVVTEEITKTEKEFPNEDVAITAEVVSPQDDTVAKKTGKAGKGAKGAKGGKEIKGKPTKPDKGGKGGKPDKAGGKGVKAPPAGKVASKAVMADKTIKEIPMAEDVPPAEPNFIIEPAPLEEVTESKITENIVEAPVVLSVDSSEEVSEIELKEFDNLDVTIEDFGDLGEEEFEEEATKRDSIDERYPIESGESDDEDKFGNATDYLQGRQVKVMQYDFFDYIGRIPDIGEISVDPSIQRFIEKLAGVVEDVSDDVVVEEEEGEEEEEEEAEDLGESKIPIEDIFSSEISLEYDFESSEEDEEAIEVAGKKVSDENLFEALLKLEKVDIIVDEIDYEELERLEQRRQLEEQTQSFLTELIDCVVEVAEYVDPMDVLRESVDKKKLFKKLYELLCDFTADRKVNTFILRKVVDYYRRQKSFRAITPHHSDIVHEEKRKFLLAVDELNSLLGKETKMEEIISRKIFKREKKEFKAKEELREEVDKLNTLMQKTFAKRASDRLNMVLDKRIKEMCALREEISEVRSMLINRQHIKARLREKMDALENIGPGLYLRDYEDLQHERYVLIKKIEERNDDLDRYRTQFHAHTNILAHLRESETMLFHTMQVQLEILDQLRLEQRRLRGIIYGLKKSRVLVQKEIREMSFQCGLIDKPALCIDYDETLERCGTQREVVKNLKNEIILVEKKIDYYTQCQTPKSRYSAFS